MTWVEVEGHAEYISAEVTTYLMRACSSSEELVVSLNSLTLLTN